MCIRDRWSCEDPFDAQFASGAFITYVVVPAFVRPFPTPRSVNRQLQVLQRYGRTGRIRQITVSIKPWRSDRRTSRLPHIGQECIRSSDSPLIGEILTWSKLRERFRRMTNGQLLRCPTRSFQKFDYAAMIRRTCGGL